MKNRLLPFVLFVAYHQGLVFPDVCAYAENNVTYSKDVAPIIDAHCVSCHRENGIAPIAFSNYREIRPWAKAIKKQVQERTMPPWAADSPLKLRNSRDFATADIQTILDWVDEGALEGDPRDLPGTRNQGTGWVIGQPDLIVDTGKNVLVPSIGDVPQQSFTVVPNLAQDEWVIAAEIQPSAPAVVHHVVVRMSDPGQKPSGAGVPILLTWVPGQEPFWGTAHTARLLPAGWTLTFEIHYTPNGKKTLDRTLLGLKFSANRPLYCEKVSSVAYSDEIVIPPGEPNHELRMSWTAPEETLITGWMPHMHLRGKDFTATVVYPNGQSKTVLVVRKYDWHWQFFYELAKPLPLPSGTRIEYVAHFDNSPRNKNNPDPLATVISGEQTNNEMLAVVYSHLVRTDAASGCSIDY